MTANPYTLRHGKHRTAKDGRCAMEWVSYLAGEPHSDRPACVSPLLQAFCIAINDALPAGQRQRMRPYLARTIGTVDDGLDNARGWMCMDWLVREYAPTFLAVVPSLRPHADTLRSLPPVLTSGHVQRAMVDLSAAQIEASTASGTAAGAAARAVARAAGTAVPAGGAAVWAGGAAAEAVRDAAKAAAGAARDAAAWDALTTSVTALQNSVLDTGGLLDRMLPTEAIQLPVAVDADLVCGA